MSYVRKRRHLLTAEEEAALTADIEIRRTLTTKMLMRKYNASRSLINSVAVKSKKALVPCETKEQTASNGHRHPMTPNEIDALAQELSQ